MTELDVVLRAPRVVTAAGEVARRVGVADGRIVAIEPLDSDLTAAEMVDLGTDEVLLPGLVDTHVHVNEPGRTEWEGFATATRAAAAGGVTTLLVHAEDSDAIDRAPTAHGERYRDYLASRPRGAENVAIAQVIEAARWTGARVHVLHLSSSDALPMIRSARRDGVRITVETCPHYLVFTAEEVPDGQTQFKCCPPIREAENREVLWAGLRAGDIDTVVSDHSPCTPDLKRLDVGDFGMAWGGIASLQVGLPAVWTEARRRGHTLCDVVRWMAERPAAIAGLQRKGHVALGHHADFCVFAPDDAFVVDPARLAHRHPVTPYAERPLAGVVRGTWLRGRRIDPDGEPSGRLLRRGEA